MWSALAAIAGAAILVFVFREIFVDLFHPSAGGALSRIVSRAVFASMRVRPQVLPSAGPLAIVIVITTWALLIAAGFAFIYWAVAPSDFRVESGLEGPSHGPWSALYFSLETMTTLGFGDIKPKPDWLRVIVTLHTLFGFALVSASITWILLIFPALSRAARLARFASVLAEGEQQSGVPVVSGDCEHVLLHFAEAIAEMRVDLVHYSVVYYFRARDDKACIAHCIGIIDRFAREGTAAGNPDRVRLAATALSRALDDCAAIISTHLRHVEPSEDRLTIFDASAKQHATTLA